MTSVDIQAWMTAVGVLLTAVIAAANFVQSRLNGKKLEHVVKQTNGITEVVAVAKDLQRIAEVGQAAAEGREMGRTEEIARQSKEST